MDGVTWRTPETQLIAQWLVANEKQLGPWINRAPATTPERVRSLRDFVTENLTEDPKALTKPVNEAMHRVDWQQILGIMGWDVLDVG